MRSWALIFLTGILFLSGARYCSAQDLKVPFAPPPGKVLLIVGQDKTSIDNYVRAVGVVPGGTMVYTSIQEVDGLSKAVDHGGGIHYGQYLLDKYPDSVLQIGLWMVGALPGIVRGEYDRNIDKLGAWIKGTRRPVFLRIGYEFDYKGNGYEPEAYRQAFRYIVSRLRKAEVRNVAYVWHSYADLPEHPWEDWYPGDDVVDWFAMSVFGKPNMYMKKLAELARQHHKGLMIAESTPQGIGIGYGASSWKFWYEPFFRFIQEEKVQIVCYIDYDWEAIPMFKGQGWGDARVEANEIVKKKWQDEILQNKYLQASSDLYKMLNY